MKNILQICIVVLTTASVSMAATIYTGGDGGDITLLTNWSDGLPDNSANVGTIASNVELPSLTSYFIVQTGGTINAAAARTLTNGSWTVDDGTWTLGNDLDLEGNQDFIVNDGNLSIGRSIDHTGDLLQINDGTLSLGRNLYNNGTSVEINGGTINMTGSGFGFLTNNDNFAINGGTITINDYLGFTSGGGRYTFGVGSGGSLTAFDFQGTRTPGDLNWLTGSQMSLTLSGENEWAEKSWTDGNLTYNGLGSSTLGTWADVTAAGGLGGSYSFVYDSSTETLSLSVIPEPSSLAIIVIGLAGLIGLRRRRR